MSDLHQALRSRIAAHTPDRVPPFEALKARRRARDRRRTVVAAAAAGLAVAAVVFVPSVLSGGGAGSDQVAQDAPDVAAADAFRFYVQAVDPAIASSTDADARDALQRCLTLPGVSGVSEQTGAPREYRGRVAGLANGRALGVCVDAVRGWHVYSKPINPVVQARAYTVRPASQDVDEPTQEGRDRCFALPGVDAAATGQPETYRATVQGTGADAFERCVLALNGLYVPELDLATHGVYASERVDTCLDGNCRTLSPVLAKQIRGDLGLADGGDPSALSQDPSCTSDRRFYVVKVFFGSDPVAIQVPAECGPMIVNGVPRPLDDEVRQRVRVAYDAAG